MLGALAHRRIYLLLLAMLAVTMTTSVWAANLAWTLLGINWLLEGRWRQKWQLAKSSRLLHAILALYALLAAGLLWSSDPAAGLHELQVKLPLAVIPLVVLTTPPVERRPRAMLLSFYVLTVVAMTVVGTVRLLTLPDLPTRQAVPHISHIRFGLHCCVALFLAASFALTRRPMPTLLRIALLAVSLWLAAFLVLLRAHTALTILAVVVPLTAVRHRRWKLVAAWGLLAALAGILVFREVRSYYRLQPIASQPLRPFTASGRPYLHACDGIVENGNYINNYRCPDELRREWNRRSTLPYDQPTATGYAVEPTLVRYLNALGLPKDSAGVATLTPEQIGHVERGIANPVYLQRNPLRQSVYTFLFEFEHHRHTRSVAGFTLLQRLALWQTTLEVIGQNPLAGTGTGALVPALQRQLAAEGSELAGHPMHPHNQYLTLAATLGIPLAALLLFLFLRAIPISRRRRLTPVAFATLLTLLLSMLTDNTLDTLHGILLATLLLPYRDV